MVQAPDAADVLGPELDTAGVQELAAERYSGGVREAMPRDFATMYHPNGTTSIILLPPLSKTGRSVQDRRGKILHYIMNKRGAQGEQWWFAQPPPGWTPQPLPYRCPVEGCSRRGGLPNLRQVWMHIRHKHPEEAILYQGILSAIEKELQSQVEGDLLGALGLSHADRATTGAAVAESTPGASGVTICECGWVVRSDSKNPEASLQTHKRLHCPLREEVS